MCLRKDLATLCYLYFDTKLNIFLWIKGVNFGWRNQHYVYRRNSTKLIGIVFALAWNRSQIFLKTPTFSCKEAVGSIGIVRPLLQRRFDKSRFSIGLLEF